MLISAGLNHSLAIRGDGSVWAWGSNRSGQLGDRTTIDSPLPVRVLGVTDAVAVAAGHDFSLALKRDGTVWSWGWNVYGALGCDIPVGASAVAPRQVDLQGVVALAAGRFHSLAIKADGTVWTWGEARRGQLGHGIETAYSPSPVQVLNLEDAVSVSGGESHSLAVRSDLTAWAWGDNGLGQLGDGSRSTSRLPVQVSGIAGVVSVAAGASGSAALKHDGTVWVWGLTAGTVNFLPVQVPALTDVSALAGGSRHLHALLNDGTIWACDREGQGPLAVPVKGITGAVALASKSLHSLAVTGDGAVFAWGTNQHGELGDGTTDSAGPVRVGISDVRLPAPDAVVEPMEVYPPALVTLTPEVERLILEVRDEWLEVAKSTDPADRGEAERGVVLAYEAAGLTPPESMLWVSSPLAGARLAAMLIALTTGTDDGAATQLEAVTILRDRVGRLRYEDVASQPTSEAERRLYQALGSRGPRMVTAELRERVEHEVPEPVTDLAWYGCVDDEQEAVAEQLWDGSRPQAWDEVAGRLAPELQDTEMLRAVGDALWALRRSVYALPPVGWRPLAALKSVDGRWATIDFYRRIGMYETDGLDGLWQVARGGCGWFWPFDNVAVLTPRPSVRVFDRRLSRSRGPLSKRRYQVLHCATGPAIGYGDGFEVFMWHGVRVPEQVIEDPASITYEQIDAAGQPLKWALIDRFGKARYAEEKAVGTAALPASVIDVAPEVFNVVEGYDYSSESVVVVGASDPALATQALSRAGARFMSVTGDGVELGHDVDVPEEEVSTPNWVSDPILTDRGPSLSVDCKSDISPRMRERFVAILVEELTRTGVLSARLEATE